MGFSRNPPTEKWHFTTTWAFLGVLPARPPVPGELLRHKAHCGFPVALRCEIELGNHDIETLRAELSLREGAGIATGESATRRIRPLPISVGKLGVPIFKREKEGVYMKLHSASSMGPPIPVYQVQVPTPWAGAVSTAYFGLAVSFDALGLVSSKIGTSKDSWKPTKNKKKKRAAGRPPPPPPPPSVSTMQVSRFSCSHSSSNGWAGFVAGSNSRPPCESPDPRLFQIGDRFPHFSAIKQTKRERRGLAVAGTRSAYNHACITPYMPTTPTAHCKGSGRPRFRPPRPSFRSRDMLILYVATPR